MSTKYTSVTLPNDLLQMVDVHISRKGYSSRAEYIKFLIRTDLKEALQ